MRRTVVIDCFDQSLQAYRNGYAIVAVDVIRATTTAVTAVARGRRCYPVPSIEAAVALARKLPEPLLAGELGGSMPYGFDLNNSPADLEVRTDVHRAEIELSWHRDRVHPTLAAIGGTAEEHIRIVVGEVGERAPCLVKIAAADAGGGINS